MIQLALIAVLLQGAYGLTVTTSTFLGTQSDCGSTAAAQPAEVYSGWLAGIGCPSTTCSTGDSTDTQNLGLLLEKAYTSDCSAAQADLNGVSGLVLTQIGYDIRKPGANIFDTRGSHCGGGAPRFDILTSNGCEYAIGCNNAANSDVALTDSRAGSVSSWQRLTWGTGASGSVQGTLLSGSGCGTLGNLQYITSPVTQMQIVFDEGADQSPDNFGLAVLDNIYVNGNYAGKGTAATPTTPAPGGKQPKPKMP